MSLNITFIEAQTQDIPILLYMMETFYTIDDYPFDKEKTEANASTLIAHPNLGRIWIIKNNQAFAGYVVLAFGFSFEYGGRDAFIDELYLEPDYRGQGIGQHVIDFLLEAAASLGVQTLHLEVEQHNERGQRLYTRNGFRHNNRILMSKKIG